MCSHESRNVTPSDPNHTEDLSNLSNSCHVRERTCSSTTLGSRGWWYGGFSMCLTAFALPPRRQKGCQWFPKVCVELCIVRSAPKGGAAGRVRGVLYFENFALFTSAYRAIFTHVTGPYHMHNYPNFRLDWCRNTANVAGTIPAAEAVDCPIGLLCEPDCNGLANNETHAGHC